MRKPSDSHLIGTRANKQFALPSCNACLRIAARRDIEIGYETNAGVVEGFSHAAGATQALIISRSSEGYVFVVPIAELVEERESVAQALSQELN